MIPVPNEGAQFTGPKRTLSLEPLEQRLLLQADWTFMVYLDADNNLESAALDDFLEMAHVGSTADVNVVVQFDRTPLDQGTGGAGYSDAYDDWSDTRRGTVALNALPNASWGASIGEANSGDPAVLEDFITWAITNYEADHYALILWDHGDGFSGVQFDDTDADFLTMSELSSGIGDALTATGVDKIDLLNFDGCLMSMVEVASQVKGVADILVTSEDLVPNDGLPYDIVLGQLTSNPVMQPVELANAMAQDYLTYYGFTGTYAVIDLAQMGPLDSALSDFATTFINQGTATDRSQLSVHWLTVPWFADPNFLDVGVLMTDISDDPLMSAAVRNAADNVLSVYADTIIANYAGSMSMGGSGLSIYLPDRTDTVDPDYNAGELIFAAETQWDEFLNWWTGVPGANWTFMVYMVGDNNLEPYAIGDFLEMASVGSTESVNIVVQFDRSSFYDTTFGDWTDTRRGLINFGDVPDTSWGASIGEANMGDPDTLADFLTWAMTNYPAENYAVTLWDHGNGLDGAMFDDDDGTLFGGPDNLTVMEIDQGLQGAPDHIDALRFDACLMSMLEVAYQLRNDADYMSSSEDLSWLVGGEGGLTPYDQVLSRLTSDPSMSDRDLMVMISQLYFQSWSVGNLTVMNQVTDLSMVDELAQAVNDLAEAAMTVGTTGDRVLMNQHRLASPFYPSDGSMGITVVDLGTWLTSVANDPNISAGISGAAANALGAYGDAIVANFTAPGDATGLAIYMPGALPAGTYNWQNFTFADDTQWDEFLGWWGANQVTPIATYVSGSARVTFYDVWGIRDINPNSILVKFSGTNVKSITLGGADPMQGLGIVISGATSVGTIADKRLAPGTIAFIASNAAAKSVQINSAIGGEWLNGRSLGGVIFPSDIDGDGNRFDTTSLFFRGGISKLTLGGTVGGGAYIRGPVGSFLLTNGDLMDDFIILGNAGKIQFQGIGWGWVWNRLFVDGNVGQLSMPDGEILPEAIVDITGYLGKANIGIIWGGSVDILDPLDSLADIPLATFDPSTFNFFYTRGATLRVGDGISRLTVDWFTPGSIFYDTAVGGDLVEPTTGTDQRYFIQYLMSNVLTPGIDRLDVAWGVAHARILAGADLGADLLPGGVGANADSYAPGFINQIRIGTEARKAGLLSISYIAGGPDAIEYSGGSVGDSLIAAGVFRTAASGFEVWGGSGYNLVVEHDGLYFEDGSRIGKVDVTGQIQSRYNEIESAGRDLSDATPPEYPYFVPFGIGSYAMDAITVQGAPASYVTLQDPFTPYHFARHPYVFVEIPRGLGANA